MSQSYFIHPDAKIGKNVRILHNSYIGEKCVIGDNCVIGPSAVLNSHTKLGNNCKIYPGAILGCIPQDLKYNGEESYVEVGDNSSIRECVTIHRGTIDRMVTKIGKNALIMAYVHIAHDCILGDNVIVGNCAQFAGHVQVDDWAIIGGTSAIHQKLRIGKHSFVGATSYLGKDVPPYIKVRGNPYNSFAGINSIGLRRRNFSLDKINTITDAYRVIYNSGFNTSHAIAELEKNTSANGINKEIVHFIKASKRGIVQRIKQADEKEALTL